MNEPRRYTDDEVREIFHAAGTAPERAAEPEGEPPRRDAPSADPTLEELAAIAREVGLDGGRVREAALALDAPGRRTPSRTDDALPPAAAGGVVQPTRRTRLGAPLALARTVDLPRAPTDAEWQILVSEMRETFGARGKLSETGNLRDWSNGNLHGAIEPTESGYRFRLSTLKGNAVAMESMGFAMAALGVAIAVMLALRGDPGDAAALGGILVAIATIYLGNNAIMLPRWAREREAQFDLLTDRARRLIEPSSVE